jgi:hypothetical protein
VRSAFDHIELAGELTELHDASVTAFVTMPVFAALMQSQECAPSLRAIATALGEHLNALDCILHDVKIRRADDDSDFTRSLFVRLTAITQRTPSPARDDEILRMVDQVMLFLIGSCAFALQCARRAGEYRVVHVLEPAIGRLTAVKARWTVSGRDVSRTADGSHNGRGLLVAPHVAHG